ncbi:MAG: oligopeptide/dipeptide ABC transporter ATP-binding protein, partial [Zoogloea sp.]|uniref:oligopeptide/dipeptide ABC transporter ATP-binding protein n=1 Tax=Zoogloea sp. TaxID=49181 RepID=UPI003F2C8386
RHPYTRSLLAAVPRVVPSSRDSGESVYGGEMPSPRNPPSGCHFHPRCSQVRAECRARYPEGVEVAPGHQVNCFLY